MDNLKTDLVRSRITSTDALFRKKPHVHDFSARNAGAGNGCTKFLHVWYFWVFLANPHAHKIPRFRGQGVLGRGWKGSANLMNSQLVAENQGLQRIL